MPENLPPLLSLVDVDDPSFQPGRARKLGASCGDESGSLEELSGKQHNLLSVLTVTGTPLVMHAVAPERVENDHSCERAWGRRIAFVHLCKMAIELPQDPRDGLTRNN